MEELRINNRIKSREQGIANVECSISNIECEVVGKRAFFLNSLSRI